MTFKISDKTTASRIDRNLAKSQKEYVDSLEKLSSGEVFTTQDPRPADRSIAENLQYKIRSLTSAKRNISDGVSFLQTAESSLSEVSNMIIRMKEINNAAASTTLSDQERRFLFVEYEALHDEINRVALTTEYNGIPLLNGESEKIPETMILRIGDPNYGEEGDNIEDDLNAIRFDGLKSIVATTAGLGLKSSKEYLADTSAEEGLSIEDVMEMMTPEDNEVFATTYDQAINTISTQRAIFGAMQERLNRSMSYVDVFQENLSAARSRIADTDFAAEVSRLTENKILMHAATSLLAQSNINAQMTLGLLSSL